MMFSGRAAAAKANILFDTGAYNNFVSETFAKQTGITIRPVEYSVRLADDKTPEVAGEATVYVHLGAFHKPVKCYVMDMLYEVDLILGEELLDKYDCILHYGKGCIMIRKGKRLLSVNSPALPRNQLPVDEEKSESVLSASQVKRLARKVLSKSVPGGDPSCEVRPCPTRGGLCRGSVSGCANFFCPT
jgi:hypothetical protein